MNATETIRTTKKHLDLLNQFLTENETGKLFNQAITEKVLAAINSAPSESNHGTIFRAGYSAGAMAVRLFVDEFDPIYLAELEKKISANEKLRQQPMLPSAAAAMKARIGQ